jgi:HK97 family phage portal protein
VAKLRPKLVQQEDGYWKEITSPAFSPVLRKPNRYQNRLQFMQQWVASKLIDGNAYVLKQRDARGVVSAMYVLDPQRVTTLIAPDGGVYYQLRRSELAQLAEEDVIVPASEMIHDRHEPLWHPLVGVSPIYASGLAAQQGLEIQNASARFFGNNSRPGGILTAPGVINPEQAEQLRTRWNENYSGANSGKVAVLGAGLTYEAISVNATDAQLIEQLKWTAETVCSAFRVPAYMIGVGPVPAYNNVEALTQMYYSQCIQSILEAAESALDDGLGLNAVPGKTLGVEFEIEGLMRMDTATRFDALGKAIGAGWMAPNEARRKEGLPPVSGGDSPMMQQQQFSLAALAERDRDKPFSKPEPAPAAQPSAQPEEQTDEAREFLAHIIKGLECAT